MFHVTLLGGTEGEITPGDFTALTVCGGAELRRPTLAAQLLHEKSRSKRRRSLLAQILGADQSLALTLLGSTVVRAPTLAEEYAALAGVLRTGALTRAEASTLLDQLSAGSEEPSLCRTMTLLGTCATHHPSAAQERKGIDVAVRAGTMPESAGQRLEEAIGAPPGARLRAVLSALDAIGLQPV